ncbi:MAG: hypothetical protein LBR21_09670 [Propionibacteriaceae bacterium]|nr:hypothetical protein [Propionibacteriaceae bacterium]
MDIVIPWVNSDDPAWQQAVARCSPAFQPSSCLATEADAQYRDWNLLRYVFRGIETFLPWVRRVFFVSMLGQKPDWLEEDCPRLTLVDHRDYIPAEWLPTFSSHPIELNLHRISDLSSRFVYFNDDTFVIRPMPESAFFVAGRPRDQVKFWSPGVRGYGYLYPHVLINNSGVLSRHFCYRTAVRNHPSVWLSPRHGAVTMAVATATSLLPSSYFPVLGAHHYPAALTKIAYEQLWACEGDLLAEVSSHKYRALSDVNQYLIRGWQQMQGVIVPRNFERDGRVFNRPDRDVNQLVETIAQRKVSLVCINDHETMTFQGGVVEKIRGAFESVLPQRSSFEKAG